jgi:hypothetical protein
MIRKEGSKWVLRSKSTGKVLGRHPTRAAAVKQEQAIEIHKYASDGEPSLLRVFVEEFIAQLEEGAQTAGRVADTRIETIVAAVKKLGVNDVREILGGGSFGTAAVDEDGHVLKLTSDPSEVQAGAVLRGKDLPHVVYIAGAWWIAGVRVATQWDNAARVGVLSLEKIEADVEEYKEIGRVVAKLKEKEGAYPEDLESLGYRDARAKLKEVSELLEGELRELAVTKRIRAALDVADALAELRAQGVYAIDVHGGNIGYNPAKKCYQVFDIGSSSAPPRPKPKTIRATARKRAAEAGEVAPMLESTPEIEEI